MNKLQTLQAILSEKRFHHATYRNQGSLWEGLYIYVNDDMGRGFKPEICFGKDDPLLLQAEDMVRHTGISLGAYGAG